MCVIPPSKRQSCNYDVGCHSEPVLSMTVPRRAGLRDCQVGPTRATVRRYPAPEAYNRGALKPTPHPVLMFQRLLEPSLLI